MREGMQQNQNRGKMKAVGKETENEKDTGTHFISGERNKSHETFEVTIYWAEWVSKNQKGCQKLIKRSAFKVRDCPIDKGSWKTWWKLINIINQSRTTEESASACQLLCALPQTPKNHYNLSMRHVKMQSSFEDAYWSLLNCSWRTSL